MLDRVRELIRNNPDREAFFRLIGKLFPYGSRDYLLINDAYDTAKNYFRGKRREVNNERYFEHLRAVALIVMVHMRVRNAEIIAAALLHDIVEDVEGWTPERVAVKFSPNVSELVWWVTKQPIEWYEGDKEARNRSYHQNLTNAPRDALIIKLADRLHNCLDLWHLHAEKQKRKIRETQDFYLPLAEKHILLIHEIEGALNTVIK